MRPILFAFVFVVLSASAFSQKKAITSTGEEVILYDDGTWKYADEADADTTAIPVNPKSYIKPEDASFLMQSKRAKFGVYFNNKKWTVEKGNEGEDREYMFQRKGKDAYVMIISERIEIPIDKFSVIALENAKDAAPDAKVVKQEYRTVNGNRVLCLQLSGTMHGIKFAYFGYYISNESGTVQLVGFTAQSLFKEYQAEIEEFLNGLVTVK
jgi:hypothetical protein